MSIADLIQAAEYLDNCSPQGFASSRTRPSLLVFAEAEHGYACSPPAQMKQRTKGKKSQGSRTTHNELEKNRRAHLRNCLESLKGIVPLGPEASKHTTLGLLTKAKRFIKSLEERDRRHNLYKEQLAREHRFLRRRLELLDMPSREVSSRRLLRRRYEQNFAPTVSLSAPTAPPMVHLAAMSRRSLSECSSASASSGSVGRCEPPDSEPASISESDEVDVIGYTSNQSDTDDHSSIQSGSGDSGVALSASRLSLAHMEII